MTSALITNYFTGIQHFMSTLAWVIGFLTPLIALALMGVAILLLIAMGKTLYERYCK